MFGKRVIRLGDPTTHGGKVVSAASNMEMFGKPVACLGDKVVCPLPGHGVATIVECDPSWNIDGKGVALEGHKCSCGCSLISTLGNVERSYEGMGTAYTGGGASAVASAGSTAKSKQKQRYDEQVRIIDEEGNPLGNLPFTVVLQSGELFQGFTDEEGKTDRYFTDDEQTIKVYVGHITENEGDVND